MGIRAFLVLLLGATALFADGGAVQFQKQAGPFVITLFSDPGTVRVGRVDLSVMCQQSQTKDAVQDAQVSIHLRKPGAGDIMEFTLFAKRSEGKNGVLYVANANLPAAGKWPVRIDIRRGKDEAMVSGVLEVLPSQPAVVTYWPLFVAVPLLALIFAINLRLRRGRALRHPRARK